MEVDRPKIFLLFSVIGRLLILFNFLSAMLFFLYLLGNFQLFMDTTQLFILENLENISLVAGIVGGYYIAVLFIMSVLKKRFFITRFIITVFSIIFNFSLVMVLKFIFSWIQN